MVCKPSLLIALLFLMTACGGNKAGTVTLKGSAGTPLSAPLTAGPVNSPSTIIPATASQTASPSATPTATPSATPTSGDPSSPTGTSPSTGTSPTTSSTPTSTPPVATTSTPGDWNSANNLAEAIFDISAMEATPNHLVYLISYYDIDHLDGQNPEKFTKFFRLSFSNTSPNQMNAQFALDSEQNTIAGSLIQCHDGCKTGTLHLTYQGAKGSKLNGSVDIDFMRKPIKKIKHEIENIESIDPREYKFAGTLKNSWFFDGMLSAFHVRGGFAEPFEVSMDFGIPEGSALSETTILHARKTGDVKKRSISYSSHGVDNHLFGFLGAAKIKTDYNSYLEMCFPVAAELKGFGVYTIENPGPVEPCDQ